MERVLLPTDLSRQSRMLVGCMPELSRFGIKKIILLYVRIEGVPLDRVIQKNLDDFRDKLQEDGYDTDLEIVTGRRPADEILEAARVHDVDTIILPSSGKGRTTHLLVGSNSLSVMKRSDVKVFLKRFVKGRGGDICEACPLTFRRTVVALPPQSRDRGFMDKVNDLVEKGGLTNILLMNPVSGSTMEYGRDSIQDPGVVHETLDTANYVVAEIPRGILETIKRESASLLVLPGCLREPLRGILRETPMGQIVHNTKASILIIPNN